MSIWSGCDGDGTPPAGRLFVAWTSDDGDGGLSAMTMRAPFRLDGAPLAIGAEALLRCAAGDLYVLSRSDGSLSIVERVDRALQSVRVIAALGAGEPVDVAIVDAATAYVTRASATRLLRLDLATGATEEVVELAQFADDDGIPDLGMMALHEGRLYVQIRRISAGSAFLYMRPAYVAVIDVATETLVDADPDAAGVQAIELFGTAAKHRLQVIEATHELFVSATGAVHDQGGIEVIDLDTLQSKGLIVHEDSDPVGADLGPFVMLNADDGYLAFSTDFDLSSHLKHFSVSGGVDPPPDMYISVGYEAPAIELDAPGRTLFFPDGEHGKRGIVAFDVASGEQLTAAPVALAGRPTDLLRDCARP